MSAVGAFAVPDVTLGMRRMRLRLVSVTIMNGWVYRAT